MSAPEQTGFREDLREVGSRAVAVLERGRTARAMGRAWDRVWILMLPLPALALLLSVVAWVFGLNAPRPGLPLLIAGALLLPLVYLVARRVAAALLHVGEPAGLAAVDRDLDLRDRLQTAAAFLDLPERTPFMQAAVADAESFRQQALAHRLVPERTSLHAGARPLVFTLLAALLITGALVIEPEPGREAGAEGGRPTLQVADAQESSRQAEQPRNPRKATPEPEQQPRTSLTEKRARRAAGRPDQAPLSKDIKETRGATGVGQSADASSSSGRSESKGVPTNQGRSGKGSKKRSKKKAKKSTKKKPAEGVQPEKKDEDPAGATAGRGAASGSNKSPAASPWSSRDQVVSDDEEDLTDEEDVDDEFEITEARGGLQPHLRDRRPPVNRDLAIGYGNQKNPDANGRGGASEQKKSRGVASLVLGVPIPDHVKGRPNPGRTKITQERVEPKAEESTAEQAAARLPRSRAIGHVSAPDLAPWMRTLVRDYYLSLRANLQKE